MIDNALKTGFIWTLEHERDGLVIDVEEAKNLAPTEMLNAIQSAIYKSGAQQANWYVGLFEGNYTPDAAVTAATIAALATESTAYNEATRVAWVGGDVAAGAVSNALSKAVFTFNAAKTIYGGFLISASAKGSVLGVLASVVRFPTPKTVGIGDILRITAGSTLISA